MRLRLNSARAKNAAAAARVPLPCPKKARRAMSQCAPLTPTAARTIPIIRTPVTQMPGSCCANRRRPTAFPPIRRPRRASKPASSRAAKPRPVPQTTVPPPVIPKTARVAVAPAFALKKPRRANGFARAKECAPASAPANANATVRRLRVAKTSRPFPFLKATAVRPFLCRNEKRRSSAPNPASICWRD